jgi:SAM-dependent methyltransferase
MTQAGTAFDHSTPALYDRYMGPLLFEPYARLIAERSALLQPTRILETAAGTGIVTRAVSEAVPQAQIVATDLNPLMIEFAAQRVRSERVAFQRADAQDLPFLDGGFDLVVCQFGVMFFPDKVRANREAWRVLASGGDYLLVSFDRLELNPVPKAAEDAVVALFPEDPLSTWSAARSAMPIRRSSSMICSRPASRTSSLKRSHYRAASAPATPPRVWCSARRSARKSSGAIRPLSTGR